MKILNKRADLYRNRVIIPIEFIKKHGRYFIMEVYDNKLIIKPQVNKEK